MAITGLLVVFVASSAPVVAASPVQPPRVAGPRLPVVVHRGGGRVVAGDYDDAKRWVSHTVQTTGRSEVTMPAFEGTDVEWRGMLSCARSMYRGLPVEFVEKPPATGDYLLVVVGGSPRRMGHTRTWGLATNIASNTVVARGVGFVFSEAHRAKDRTIALCETLAHEVGHMIGLKHSPDCNDVMNTSKACTNRDYTRGRLRTFRQASWSVLERSLAAWTQRSAHPETRFADSPRDPAQTSRARVVPAPTQRDRGPAD